MINLERSTARKEYMDRLLAPYGSMLEIEYIKAVDGRALTEKQREDAFDYARSMKHYGRRLNDGEVGCALSHNLCYRQLLGSENPYALILEDDISLMRDLRQLDLEAADKLLNVDKPRALMLSGDYWYWTRKPICHLYSAVGAYAFCINKAAARLLLEDKPYTVADDWQAFGGMGVQLFAVNPYMIDANIHMDKLSSDVKQDSWGLDRRKMSLAETVSSLVSSTVRKIMKAAGHFEYKTRIMENVAVEREKNPFK